MFGIPMRHFARYHEILSVLIHHGLGYFLRPAYGQAENLENVGVHLRDAFTELGPTFVKVGQLASTRSDIIPQPILKELAKLQDQVRPLSLGEVRGVIEEALQVKMESVFSEFDPKPLAAASIGQVHQAVLVRGERVVVKVQRPHIQENIKTDLEIFGTLVTQIEQRTAWGKQIPLRMLLEEFSKTLLEELDFLNEGRNAERIAQFNRKNKDLLIPKIYWSYSRSSVLTMQYIAGIPLSQRINSEKSLGDVSDYNPHHVAKQLSHVLLKQILQDGFFHADPHPGNILILPEGKIGLIDFGIIGTLNPARRLQLTDLIAALVQGKDEQVLEMLTQMGIVPEHLNREAFRVDLSALRAKHLRSSEKLHLGEAIQDFFNIVLQHGIYIPSEFVLIGKSMMTLEGVLNRLDPTLSLVEQSMPFSRKLLWDKYNPRNLLERIWSHKGERIL